MIADAFSRQTAYLSESTDGVSERLTSLSESFRQQSRDLVSAGDEANRQVRDVSDVLSQQTEKLVDATGQAKSQIETIKQTVDVQARELTETVDSVVGKTQQAGREFDRQAVVLTQASGEAATQAEKLKGQVDEAQRDVFLRTARHIVEDLHSTSIDLTRLLNNEISDSDWKRYVKGERGIFTRAILGTRGSSITAQITEKVKGNDDMRRYVLRYIDSFERMLKEAEQVDPEKLLHSTFMTGDVGKLYLLLCRGVGREPYGD